jgi:hypothetical protein
MGLLDRRDFCSLLVAVDDHYLDKLVTTYPTWIACHPEILNMPHLLVYDSLQVRSTDPRFAQLSEMAERLALSSNRLPPPEWRLVPWVQPEAESQRERMLTGLIRCCSAVQTPWYLKLDADTFANARTGFYFDRWFRQNPVFIASPWGYTKPADSLDRLDAWASTVPELRDGQAIERQVVLKDGLPWKVNHRRMASWVMFGRTDWTVWASGLCKGRLPFPSQDTYLSYLAVRTAAPWLTVKFRHFGWEHCKNPGGLRAACAGVLERLKNGTHPSR